MKLESEITQAKQDREELLIQREIHRRIDEHRQPVLCNDRLVATHPFVLAKHVSFFSRSRQEVQDGLLESPSWTKENNLLWKLPYLYR